MIFKTFSPYRIFLSALFVLAGILNCNVVAAQTTAPDAPKINIPTSPEAAMFKRFGDIPVGYYTGTANISIPLYNLTESGVSIPISLNYHSSGIKVEDQATWVGLGWELMAEGQVVQEVRGKNDHVDNLDNPCVGDEYNLFLQRFQYLQDYMFLYQYGRTPLPVTSCMFTQGHAPPYHGSYEDPYCIVDQLLRGVRQPDIYHYNFGNYSGKFYVNPQTNAVVMIDKKEGVVFSNPSSSLVQATTPDGTIYNFAVTEMANAATLQEYTGQTFKLSNITFVNGKTIDFTYVSQSYSERRKSEWVDAMGTETLGISWNIVSTDHNKKALTRITSADTYIDFNMTSRDDINIAGAINPVKKLSSIDITSRLSGKKIKTYELSYSYFPYNLNGIQVDSYTTTNMDAIGKRLKLDQVKEIGYTDNGTAVTNIPPYIFSYDMSVTMPGKTSTSQDFWGYYNGAFNTTLVPNLDYFDYLFKPEYETINLEKKYQYTGSNRFANNATAGAYMLNRVTYPTGGYTDFGYEPNSFTNAFIPDQSQNFVKNIQVEDNSISMPSSKTTTFKLSRATTIHFTNKINNGKGNYNGITPLTQIDMHPGCYIKFSKFKFVNGVPTLTLIKEWNLSTVTNLDFTNNGGATWTEDVRVEYDPDPDPYFNYQVTVEFPDNLNNVLFASIAGVVSQFTYSDETGINTSESKQCGMRIKTIKNYTQSGSLASDKLIKYYNGKMLNKFRPISMYKVNMLDVAGVTGGSPYEYIGFYKKMIVRDRGFGTEGGNLIGYGKVEEVELTGGAELTGKKVYHYFNEENKTQQDCPNIPFGNNGEITKEEVYDASENLVADKTYMYSYLTPFPAKYMCINIVRLAIGSKVPCGYSYNTSNPYTTYNYSEPGGVYIAAAYGYNAYTINCEYHKLTSVVSKQYSNGNFISTTETYNYNLNGILSWKTSVNSKNETIADYYYYAPDMVVTPGYNYMTNKKMIGVPVLTERYNGGEKLSSQKTVYGAFSGAPGYLPQYVYQQLKSNPEEVGMTIDAYDDKGNVTQYTGRNGIPVSVVWNADKTVPVAKVENATYATLLALPGGLTADFRTALPNARVTTYTYKPLIGVTTITDANNKKQYYEYDEFNRLSLIRDHDNNILKSICYNYAGQTIACPGSAPPAPVCSPVTHVVVNSANPNNYSGYVAKFTNTTNSSIIYTYPIVNGSLMLGCLPNGRYSLQIYKPAGGLGEIILFHCNAITASGSSATFSVNTGFTGDINISMEPDL